jgi:phage head maturation protease
MNENTELLNRLSSNKIILRAAPLVPKTTDAKARTVEAIFATETPVAVFDWERYEIVNEILFMSGLQKPEKIPMLDSHDRYTVKNQLGSCTDMRVEGDKLIGKLNFGRKQSSIEAFQDIEDGHVTDVSVGYTQLRSTFIEAGKSYTDETTGKTFQGPVRLTFEWAIKEESVVCIGADALCKMRATPETDKDAIIKEQKTRIETLENMNTRLLTTIIINIQAKGEK